MKNILTTYTFTPGAANVGSVTLTGLNIPQSQILIISNSTRGTILYNFASITTGAFSYTQATNSILVFNTDTTACSNTDKLTIFYEDGINLTSTSINGKNRLDVSLAGGHASGSAVNGYGNMIGGSDGVNFKYLSVDTAGRPNMNLAPAFVLSGASYNSTTGLINTDILSGNVSGWYDAAAFLGRTIYIVIATGASTAGTLTFEQTNDSTLDPSGFSLNLQDAALLTQANSTSQALAANTIYRRIGTVSSRYIRFRLSVAITAGTVQSTVNFSPTSTIPHTLSVNQATGASMNVAVSALPTLAAVTSLSQIAASVPLMAVANGSTNKALGVSIASAMANTDHNAVAFAGSGRISGTVVASGLGGGQSCAFNISATVTNVGSATALLPVLQESLDSGTTWSDIWTCHPFTTTQTVRVPALPISGRRRWSVHNVGGTSTTVPMTIIAQELPGQALIQRQYVDVYAATNPMQSIINGVTTSTTLVSTTLNSTSGIAIVEGCKNITISGVFTGGTPSTAPVYTLQVSNDTTNWFSTATTMSPTSAGCFMSTLTNAAYRFARLTVSTASSGGTPYGVTYTAINGIN